MMLKFEIVAAAGSAPLVRHDWDLSAGNHQSSMDNGMNAVLDNSPKPQV